MLLRELANVSAGHPFRGSLSGEKLVGGEFCSVVQMKDIDANGHINLRKCEKASIIVKRTTDFLRNRDIVFAGKGSRNYSALIDIDTQVEGVKAVASPHLYVISTKSESVLPEFLVWWLNRSHCQKYFVRNAEGSVTKSIRRTVLEKVDIELPSIEKQQSILNLHNTLLKQRAALRKQISNADKMEDAIARDLIEAGSKSGYDDLFS